MAAAGVALTARRPLLGLLLARLPAALFMAARQRRRRAARRLAAASTRPLGLAGLAVPGLLVASTYELQSRRSAEARLFAALATEQQHPAGRSLEQSVAVLMTVAARMLGGADVELLLSGPEGLVRYTGDESGVSGRARTDPSAFDAPWVRQLLARGPVRIALDDGRPSCAFSIGTGPTPARRRRGPPSARRLRVSPPRRRLRPRSGSAGCPLADAVAGAAASPVIRGWKWSARSPGASCVRPSRPQIRNGRAGCWMRSTRLERAVAALLGSAPGGAIPPQRDRRTEPRAR